MSFAFSRRLLKQAIALALGLALGLGLVWAVLFGYRGWQLETLFDPDKIVYNFRNMYRLFYTSLIPKGESFRETRLRVAMSGYRLHASFILRSPTIGKRKLGPCGLELCFGKHACRMLFRFWLSFGIGYMSNEESFSGTTQML